MFQWRNDSDIKIEEIRSTVQWNRDRQTDSSQTDRQLAERQTSSRQIDSPEIDSSQTDRQTPPPHTLQDIGS